MTAGTRLPASVDDVVEVRCFGPEDAQVRVVLEVPHGATRDDDFERWRATVRSSLPSDLVAFFRVNTDFGAPEIAEATARRLARANPALAVVVVRGLVPRTLLDLNRDLDAAADTTMTPGLPPWIRDERDEQRLRAAWRTYDRVAGATCRTVCRDGGIALAVHTYAPRAVAVDRVDEAIVETMREAYRPETLARWPVRPEIDMILPRDGDGIVVHDGWIAAAAAELAGSGFEVGRSATYRLVRGTLAWRRAHDHPARTACFEVRRDRIGDPWVPFEPSAIDDGAVARIADALADATASAVVDGSRPGRSDPK